MCIINLFVTSCTQSVSHNIFSLEQFLGRWHLESGEKLLLASDRIDNFPWKPPLAPDSPGNHHCHDMEGWTQTSSLLGVYDIEEISERGQDSSEISDLSVKWRERGGGEGHAQDEGRPGRAANVQDLLQWNRSVWAQQTHGGAHLSWPQYQVLSHKLPLYLLLQYFINHRFTAKIARHGMYRNHSVNL